MRMNQCAWDFTPTRNSTGTETQVFCIRNSGQHRSLGRCGCRTVAQGIDGIPGQATLLGPSVKHPHVRCPNDQWLSDRSIGLEQQNINESRHVFHKRVHGLAKPDERIYLSLYGYLSGPELDQSCTQDLWLPVSCRQPWNHSQLRLKVSRIRGQLPATLLRVSCQKSS